LDLKSSDRHTTVNIEVGWRAGRERASWHRLHDNHRGADRCETVAGV